MSCRLCHETNLFNSNLSGSKLLILTPILLTITQPNVSISANIFSSSYQSNFTSKNWKIYWWTTDNTKQYSSISCFCKSQRVVVSCQATVANILNINLNFKISEDTHSQWSDSTRNHEKVRSTPISAIRHKSHVWVCRKQEDHKNKASTWGHYPLCASSWIYLIRLCFPLSHRATAHANICPPAHTLQESYASNMFKEISVCSQIQQQKK